MNLQKITLEALRDKTVAVLGYGNQGRAHALNLRDSGVRVVVGARAGGKAHASAVQDGLSPVALTEAVEAADIVMLLLPDQEIPKVYADLAPILRRGKKMVGFAHGFAYHFGLIEKFAECAYFLVSPKGAGAILRRNFEQGGGLPAVYAIGQCGEATKAVALAYAKGIGGATSYLGETTFAEETECDLFGEQAVLCGGIMELMQSAFETLVRNGHSPEMAFFECCFEARLITELWMKYGPAGMTERISPTAFYGGLTRGKRLVTDETKREMEKIFGEVRSGVFAREWMEEVKNGMPRLKARTAELREHPLQKVYDRVAPSLTK